MIILELKYCILIYNSFSQSIFPGKLSERNILRKMAFMYLFEGLESTEYHVLLLEFKIYMTKLKINPTTVTLFCDCLNFAIKHFLHIRAVVIL